MNKILSLRTFLPATLDYSVLSCRIRSALVTQLRRQSGPAGDGVVGAGDGSAGGSTEDNNNFDMNPVFENRNPRNLELLGMARKQKGWKFQAPRKDFYYSLVFEKTHWNIRGMVEHSSGTTVVEAYTREPTLEKQLTSCVDMNAATFIGKILGRRCMRAGIGNVFYDEQPEDKASPSIQAFLQSVQESGVELSEVDEVEVVNKYGVDYSRRHRVGERRKHQHDYQWE